MDEAVELGRAADAYRLDVPSPARMYDFWLGGKDNVECDREAALAVEAVAPSVPRAARENRAFLVRAVRFCAQVGLDQFVDVGTGFPTSPNMAEVARESAPGSVLVGVDNDPVVLSHGRALATGMHFIDGDVRQPGSIVHDPRLNVLIDWSRPVAVLLVAVLHFVTEEDDPAAIVTAFTERMAPGSVLMLSHVCSTGADPGAVAAIEGIYAGASCPGVFRTGQQILGLFGGLDLLSPGLVPVQQWHDPDDAIDGAEVLTDIPVLGGLAVKVGTCTERKR